MYWWISTVIMIIKLPEGELLFLSLMTCMDSDYHANWKIRHIHLYTYMPVVDIIIMYARATVCNLV